MKLGEMSFREAVRFFVFGAIVCGGWGFAIVMILTVAERVWPSSDRRSITEQDLRPPRANFRLLEGSSPPLARAGTTYVPVYSTVYLGEREVQAGMAVTLSIRNTSLDRDLLVDRVDYYDTGGKLTTRLAEGAHVIPAMATAEFFIDWRDPVGGPGANYVVGWSTPEGGTDPVIEALVVGPYRTGGISFVSRGTVVTGRGGP